MEAGTQEYAAKLNAVVQNLESRATALNARKREYELPEQMSHDVMVPVAGCAFFPGTIVHTNEILVLLGENYFAERTASQARQIIQRRLDFLKESIEAVERPLAAFQTRKDVIDEYQEEYHSDEESQKKKIDAAREKEKQAEEEAVRRRNLFVKEVKTEKVEKTDEEFLRLERRLAELEAEEARVEHGGSQSTADVAASGKAEEEDDDDGEDEDGDEDEGDAFDEFYTTGDDDESVSDDGEGEEEPAEISDEGEEDEEEDEEEDTRANKQLKSVHLRTHTPPHPSKRPVKPASVPGNSPAATKGAGAAVVKVAEAEATEPIEKPRVSFSTQTLPAYVRPPVPPGKLKPCLAPPRPITVAAPPPKEVRWTHSTDADLPRYKARPPPQPQPVVTGNRSRSSARGPPPPSIQALQAAASVTAAAAAAEPARNVAVGEVMERAAPAAALPVATTEAQSAPAEAPRKVSRYRAMMEQRQGN